jgi:osmoprotectant transport system permease protein
VNLLGELFSFLTTASNWTGPRGLLALGANQLLVSAVAVLAALAVAVPLGLVIGHARRGAAATAGVANIGRALPSFAILVLAFSVFSQWGRGLSIWPTAVALTLLAIPPLLTNTITGVGEVDPEVRSAAEAAGMRPHQVLWRVEAPLALPLVLTGLRVSATQVVATATIGAWVGFQCLGTLIFEGFAQQDDTRILAGAVLVSALTIVTDVAIGAVARRTGRWSREPGRLVVET